MWIVLLPMLVVCLLAGCKAERISDDPNMRLTFSTDTLSFDTVFTRIGSSTRAVMIRNTNANALRIDGIKQERASSPFQININGETNTDYMSGWVLNGGDSLYMYVRVNIDPNNADAAFLEEDNIAFSINGNTQLLHLEAYGENAHIIRSKKGISEYDILDLKADLPYLIYDTLIVSGILHIEPGARLYFHRGAGIYAYGNVSAQGTEEKPIILMGDRRDQLFENVPYSYAAGMWDGIFLIAPENKLPIPLKNNYTFSHTHIISANIGLYVASVSTTLRPMLTMDHCRIHNHSLYGLVLSNADANIRYTEISNAASYCVYLAGGKHRFDYTTVASYFGHTDVNIQTTGRDNVAAIYVNNLDKENADTELHLTNSVVVALRDNPIVVATPLQQYYHGDIANSYVHRDTAHIFRNTYYKYQVYDYYDFRLDSLSPARYAAQDSTDAGCYPYEAY